MGDRILRGIPGSFVLGLPSLYSDEPPSLVDGATGGVVMEADARLCGGSGGNFL